MKLRWMGTVGLAAALALTACGGGSSNSGSSGGNTQQTVVGTADLKFNPTTLTIPANKDVTIKLENAATAGLKHNFVVVRPGTESAVAQKALPSGEIEADGQDVLVAGNLVDGGDSENIKIDSGKLKAGTYSYICTFPGHETSMKGTLTVQ